jgi:shikimate dehydrogenase
VTTPGGSSEPDIRLEVWGDPIGHSRSPEIHAAAYRVLGLPWQYRRRRVDVATFAATLAALDRSYRGLSLTMPLKGVAYEAARARDHRAELTGSVNTLLLMPDGPRGFNTDVGGIVRDLAAHGVSDVRTARIVGAGATATSALVALAELGADRVWVAARRPAAIRPLVQLGDALGVEVRPEAMDAGERARVEATVSTLPGGAEVDPAAAASLASAGGLLYDVVYGHWPTALARAWTRAGGRAEAGTGMLVQQALLQVRVFTQGDPASVLPDEERVLAAMAAAVAGAVAMAEPAVPAMGD